MASKLTKHSKSCIGQIYTYFNDLQRLKAFEFIRKRSDFKLLTPAKEVILCPSLRIDFYLFYLTQ
jgi:hypothetical protein